MGHSIRLFRHIAILGALYILPATACADSSSPSTEDSQTESVEQSSHRIDLTTLYVDEFKSNSATLALGYTYNINSNSNLSLSLPYLDESANGGDSGAGDLTISYSFVPFVAISAAPWVPRRVGSGLTLVLPTSSSRISSRPDTTIISPFLGFVYPVSSRFSLLPSLGYLYSTSETAFDSDVRLGVAEIGLSYVTPVGFWINYLPEAIHDFEVGNTAYNHRLSIGKEISRRIGLSFDYARLDRNNFTVDIPAADGTDTLYEFNFHISF